MIVKIPDGSFSIGVERADDARQLREIAERMLKRSEIILLQDFIKTKFDWRIGVLDGEPLFAARYFMCDQHWQILKHSPDGTHAEGSTNAVSLSDVPQQVLERALQAARQVRVRELRSPEPSHIGPAPSAIPFDNPLPPIESLSERFA